MRALIRAAALPLVLAAALHATPAAAQQSVEDKLRDALRRQTVEFRALQDSVASLQAAKEAAEKSVADYARALEDRDATIRKLQEATAGKPAAAAAPPPPDQGEPRKLRDALAAASQQSASLQADLAKSQAAAQAEQARGRELEARLTAAGQAVRYARQENEKLAALATDILHLYRTQSFINLLLKSYEPVLGLKKVDLENLVQDYEDRIDALRDFGTGAPAGAASPAGAAK